MENESLRDGGREQTIVELEAYNQRHWNKEQTDRNQRGVGRGNRGKKGTGHQGTCIKDRWTKPK